MAFFSYSKQRNEMENEFVLAQDQGIFIENTDMF